MENQVNTQAAVAATLNNIAKENAAMAKADKPKAARVNKPKAPKTFSAGNAAMSMIANTAKVTMVTVGGTNNEPTKEDAAKYASVTLAELSNSGNTLQSLAFNLLAGTVDKSITAESLKDLPRALRNEKTAITGLIAKKSADIRAAWEREQASRKRLDRPTLRALWAAVKEKKARGSNETWQQKVTKILDGKQSDKMKIQMLRELAAPKGE